MLVLAHHCEVPGFAGGYSGVDLFFVLSGYLITSILRSEAERGGGIDLMRFYCGRAIRLWPPLLLMLAMYAAASPWFFVVSDLQRDLLLTSTYLADYSFAFWQVPDYLRHTWSLAVEEHFYLIWPLVIMLTARWKPMMLAVLFIALFVGDTVWRLLQLLVFADWWHRIYFSFDTRVSGLMLGAAIAVLPWRPERSADWLAGSALAVVAMNVAFLATRGQFILGSVSFDVTAAVLVLALAGKPGRVAGALSKQPFVYLGMLSYSIYLISYPIQRALDHQYSWPVMLAIVFAGSLVFAVVTFELVEKPVKKWRHGLAASDAAASRQLPPRAVVNPAAD